MLKNNAKSSAHKYSISILKLERTSEMFRQHDLRMKGLLTEDLEELSETLIYALTNSIEILENHEN